MNGIDDFLVGAPGISAAGLGPGDAYLIFGQDSTAPTAALTSAPDVTEASNATRYDFTVTFADNARIDVSTLDDNDLRITEPGGFSVLAAVFVWKFVPESKGVTLEAMQKLWKRQPAAAA